MKDYLQPVIAPLCIGMEQVNLKSGGDEPDEPNFWIVWAGHDSGTHSCVYVIAKRPEVPPTKVTITLSYNTEYGANGGYSRLDNEADGQEFHGILQKPIGVDRTIPDRPVYTFTIDAYDKFSNDCYHFGLGSFEFYYDRNQNRIHYADGHEGAYCEGGTPGDDRSNTGSTANFVLKATVKWS